MTTSQIPYRRNAVEPFECIRAGWEMVKGQYWLFLGMCVVVMLIGQAVPVILMGPMMCGVYLALLKQRRGEPVEFGTVFKGFDYFGPSLIATLLHMVPILVIVFPAYIFFLMGLIGSAAAQGEDPSPLTIFGMLAMFALFFLVVFGGIILISIGFTFAYPLIVDRRLQGFDAVKLSFRAALANFWRLLGMAILTGLLSLAGMALCYIGIFLALPMTYAAVAAAYEQVFGLANPSDVSNMPPPPPTFN